MCRRCGAPLHTDIEDARVTIPPTIAKLRAAHLGVPPRTPAKGAPRAAATVAEPVFGSSVPDTLLPGALARPDNLLPRPPHSAPARPMVPARAVATHPVGVGELVQAHWRHLVAIVVVGGALTMGLVALWPVVFGSDGSSAASRRAQQEQVRATTLLTTVVGGARTLFATRHTFAELSPAELRARSHNVPIVAWTTNARLGEVSMRGTTTLLTLATPANAKRCVFARDEPGKAGVQFVTLPTADCRAASAPDAGWSPG
jgi:hypothetical protein